MSRKLIGPQLMEPKNAICLHYIGGGPENEYKQLFHSNPENLCREYDKAMYAYAIPKYVATALFDDGYVKLGGVMEFNQQNMNSGFLWNNEFNEEKEFYWNHILYRINDSVAEALVRHEYYITGRDKIATRCLIYQDLLKAGVEISEDAKMCLSPQYLGI